jgi:hypothetical protein
MTDAGVVLTDVQFGAEWKYPEIPEFAKEAPAIAE